jgi:2'-phosphotransferase
MEANIDQSAMAEDVAIEEHVVEERPYNAYRRRFPCAGVVVFHQAANGQLSVVLVQSKRRWSFPKGKWETLGKLVGESLLETATRELQEETGIVPLNCLFVPSYVLEEKKDETGNLSVVYLIAQLQKIKKFTYNEAELVEVKLMPIEKAMELPDDVFMARRKKILSDAYNIFLATDNFHKGEEIETELKLIKAAREHFAPKPLQLQQGAVKMLAKADIKQSKQLAWLLRHGAGDSLDAAGYMDVKAVCKRLGISHRNLELIVENNDKKRFEFNAKKTHIRATQGHSIAKVKTDELLTPLLHSAEIGVWNEAAQCHQCVHGTNYSRIKRFVPKIIGHNDYDAELKEEHDQETIGLSRMMRNHIHLVKSDSDDRCKNFDCFFYVNVEAALAMGIKFYASNNDVILTEGNAKGVLPGRLLTMVIRQHVQL